MFPFVIHNGTAAHIELQRFKDTYHATGYLVANMVLLSQTRMCMLFIFLLTIFYLNTSLGGWLINVITEKHEYIFTVGLLFP